ncbi:membrane protein [Pelistega indica]|uniref:Membrane protein n=1 Tax=Pelistega indica TaxID=1414851 RepID=V8G8R9_9BURK|nr:OmpA family protein [Pelistega indica]ETD72358.1 membrane protein [Pelistega indica]
MKLSRLAISLVTVSALSACVNLKDVDNDWCGPESQPVKQEQVTLAADALFQFDKSNPSDLLAEGKKTLDELVTKITEGYATVDRIDLVGHTDRLGTEAYNYNLGLNRAKTVKAYLEQGGISAPISVASAGESQPVTKDCVGERATPALTACLQPDRRVTVAITGIRKPTAKK